MSIDTSKRQPKNVLVTGAAGFIGSNLVHYLLKRWPDASIVSLDALTYAGNLANLKDLDDVPRHRFVHGNICDRETVSTLLDQDIDTVINAAAHTHVDRSLLGADDFAGTNVGGVQVFLDAIKQRPHIRFVQISTDEVYGSQAPGEDADENYRLTPRNPYSATKTGGDLVALAFHHSFDLDVVITRCCNNYGPYQYPEKMIPLFITNLFENKQVPLYGDGLHARQWIHVDDHSAAIARVAESGRSGEVYNITSGKGMTNKEMTAKLLAITGKDESLIKYVTDRPGHDRRYAIDDRKIRTELGWSPVVDFDEGIKQTVQWFVDHKSWWEPIKSGQYRKYYEEQYGKRVEQ